MHYLYTDGGSRNNPGPAACGCVLLDEKELIAVDAKYLGTRTNNQAEYEGIILGLELAEKNGAKELECYLDSELIVKQVRGEYKVKDEGMKALYSVLMEKLKSFKKIEFFHVFRRKNKIADKLVNIVLDSAK